MKGKLYIFLLFGLIFSLAGMQQAQATQIVFDLDYSFSPPSAPGGDSKEDPWAQATFDDFGKDNFVQLKMEATDLLKGEFISQWYFNFDPLISSEDLIKSIDFLSIQTSGVGIQSLAINQNSHKAGGDGYYDMVIDFQTADNDLGRFTNDDWVTIPFGLDGLEPEDFEFLSSPIPAKKTLKVEEDIKKSEEKIDELKKEIETAKKKLETETDKNEIKKIEKNIEKAEKDIAKEEEQIKTANESESNKGLFYSAAHIQGIGTNNEDSAWIAPDPNPVPEPATMVLVGMGLIGLAGFGRRRLKT